MTKKIAPHTMHATLFALGIAAVGVAAAQNAPVSSPSIAVPANALSLADIEGKMLAQGITIKEIELKDRLVEVEGYDSIGRKVELTIDRRSGESLSQKTKSKK
jgi:Peptidase propeptide and YPEB domain